MLLVGSALVGFAVESADGTLGIVDDLLFDDTTWAIRWVAVNTGAWLSGRKILLHPPAIEKPVPGRGVLTVRLSKRQVQDSPVSLADAPVSQQMERGLYGHYGWDPLWGGGNYLGSNPHSMGAAFEASANHEGADLIAAERSGSLAGDADPHLRSMRAIAGYHIQASDGPIGHLADVLIDADAWRIRSLIVETRNWWPGRHVLVSPRAVGEISWSERDVTLRVTRDQVKAGPDWDPAEAESGRTDQP